MKTSPNTNQLNVWFSLLALLIASIGNAETPQPLAAISGYWVTPDGSALLEAYDDGGHLTVRIVALREPHLTVADGKAAPVRQQEGQKEEQPRVDIHNPNAELRQRSLIGLPIVSGLVFEDDDWRGGSIYDPSSGKRYRCRLRLIDKNFLQVRAYLGWSLLGETQYWQRASRFQQQVTQMLQPVDEQ